MTIPTPTPTPEQIAEQLRLARQWQRDCEGKLINDLADLIEALAAQLVEARGQLRYQRILTEQIQTSHDLAATAVAEAQDISDSRAHMLEKKSHELRKEWIRAENAEAAAASARETALEEAAQVCDQWAANLRKPPAVFEEQALAVSQRADEIRALKSTPPAPATPLTESEVMPDTPGSRSNSGDTATPQASMLAPGADAPEPDDCYERVPNGALTVKTVEVQGLREDIDKLIGVVKRGQSLCPSATNDLARDKFNEGIGSLPRWIRERLGLTRAQG